MKTAATLNQAIDLARYSPLGTFHERYYALHSGVFQRRCSAVRPQSSLAKRRGGALRARRGGLRRGIGGVGGEAYGFEDHRDAALDMVGADDGEGPAGVGPDATPAVIGQGGLVGGVIGVGKFVVLGFGDPSESVS